MVDDAAEAGHLIVGGQIVKERAKRRDHKCEAAIQGERTHIARGNGHALLDVGRQRGELLAQRVEHAGIGIERADRVVILSDRDRDAAGTGAQFEHRSRHLAGAGSIPRDVIPKRTRIDDVVEGRIVGRRHDRVILLAV